MKLILLHLLSLLCLSHQKGEINKGAEDIKKFIDKVGWFKPKDPLIIRINEKSIINTGKEATNTPGTLPVTANRGEEGISSNSSPAVAQENVITLEEIVDQIKDLGTGIIQPTSKSSDLGGVEKALDSLAQTGQASISAVSNSADEILQQPLVKSSEMIQKSCAIVTGGTDTTGATGDELVKVPEALNSVATLPISRMVDPSILHTVSDESGAKPNSNNGLTSPAVTTQSQMSPSTQQINPTATQLQASVSAISPVDAKPKQIITGSGVNQIQQAINIKPNNNPQPIQFLIPQIQIPVGLPQFQNGAGFMFGNFFNLIPQIQQAIPQFVPPIIYPILPKVLTPILPPIVSNIIFPTISKPQE